MKFKQDKIKGIHIASIKLGFKLIPRMMFKLTKTWCRPITKKTWISYFMILIMEQNKHRLEIISKDKIMIKMMWTHKK